MTSHSLKIALWLQMAVILDPPSWNFHQLAEVKIFSSFKFFNNMNKEMHYAHGNSQYLSENGCFGTTSCRVNKNLSLNLWGLKC